MRRRRNLKRRLNCPLSLMNIIPINDSSSQYAFHQVLSICSGKGPAGKVLRSRLLWWHTSISVSIVAAGFFTYFLLLAYHRRIDGHLPPCTHRIFVRWGFVGSLAWFDSRLQAAEGPGTLLFSRYRSAPNLVEIDGLMAQYFCCWVSLMIWSLLVGVVIDSGINTKNIAKLS